MNTNKSLWINLLIIFAFLIVFLKVSPLIGGFLLVAFIIYKLVSIRPIIFAITGNSLYSKGDKEKALSYFKKAYAIKSCPPRVATSYAYLLLRDRQVEESRNILEPLLNKKGLKLQDKAVMHMTYALVLWKQGDLDSAVNTLEEVYSYFKSSTLYESLGYLLLLQGNKEKALSFNLEAMDYNNDNDMIKDNLAQSYYAVGDYDKAEEIYVDLTNKNLTFPEPFYYYGLILKHKDNLAKAEEMFKKALTLKESFLSELKKEKIEEELKNLSEAL